MLILFTISGYVNIFIIIIIIQHLPVS